MDNAIMQITAPGSSPSGGIAPQGEDSTLKASTTASAMTNGSGSSFSGPMANKDGSKGRMNSQMLMMMTRQWEADVTYLLRPACHPAWLSKTTP